MKLVKQRHINGCASAVIAMITGKSYMKIFKSLNPKKKSFYDGLEFETFLRALSKSKIKYSISFKKPNLSKLKHNAVIGINCTSGNQGARHVVVWDKNKQRILDPDVSWSKKSCMKHFSFLIEVL